MVHNSIKIRYRIKIQVGNTINLNQNYSDLILDASKTSGVSAYHLSSRIKQEIGCFLSHNSISGTFPGYEGYYNFYNIGATSSTEPNGAIINGLEYAKNGKNASLETRQKYYIPWNTPQRSITGGAVFIGSSYISIGQYNLYLQKFDVNNSNKSSLFWHQYMTNCLAPYNESSSICNAYIANGMINNSIAFVIPIYNNMPERLSQSPDINSNEYVEDGGRVYANVSTTLNLRAGPSVNYEIVTSVGAKQEMTRISRGIQNGERWDRVVLDNGIEGYVFQGYIEKVIKPNIASITLSLDNSIIEKGKKAVINTTIQPEDVQDSTIIWSSSNDKVLTVSNKGEITALSKGTATVTAEAKFRRSKK